MEELKACPFCGKKDTVDFTTCVETEDCAHFEECPEEEPYYCVVCNIHKGGCGASGGFAPTRQETVEKWNRRAAPENKALTLDELRKMDKRTDVEIRPLKPRLWHAYTDSISTGCFETYRYEDYGKTWLAYARRPEDAP